jgi:hypothetical protein
MMKLESASVLRNLTFCMSCKGTVLLAITLHAPRHCERSEAIQLWAGEFWIASSLRSSQ